MKLYSVYDITAGTYSEPFCAAANEVAIRNFRFTMMKYDDFFVKDMKLYCIGEFDNVTGSVDSYTSPEVIDSGSVILREKEIDKEIEEAKK